jgi:lipopolysaccharide assembly outer membrane protein LptD (OstA)
MKKKIFILIVLILAVGLNAQSGKSRKSKVKALEAEPKIQADNQEITEDKLIASGNVEIAWEEYRIYADYLEFNPKTKEIIAKGRVSMASSETVITGEKLRFNLKKKTGEMYDTYGQMPPTIRYTTDKLMQVDNDTLRFKKLHFTSCSQCVPRWKITCARGKIKKEKYIEMKHTIFKIKKIPVFYFPYIRYPVNKDGRATGILIPNIGNSSIRGFFLLNSFFWAIKSNVDLTLNFDYYAKAGIGAAEEFRYLFRNMDGNIKFYFFKYKEDNILGTDSASDYLLNINHKQKINFLNTRLNVTIDRQSDANFLRLFSNDFDAVLRRISRSSVSINSSISNLKFSFSASQNDTYYTFADRSSTVRYLPSVRINLNQQKIWKLPGYLSLSASYSTVNRVGKSYEEDEEKLLTDITSTRMSLSPSYTLSLLKFPWLSTNLILQSRHSFYPKSRDPEDKKIILDEPLNLQYMSALLTLKGPVFSKIFEFRNSKIKHLIEPKITFRYVTQVDDEIKARLITVDYSDFPSYSYVGFSLTTRLLYKSARSTSASAREIFSYVVKQDYYFDPALANRNRQIEGVFPEFSQLTNTIRMRPSKGFSLDASLIYNYYRTEFTRVRLSLSYKNKKNSINGNFFYTSYINQYAKPDYVMNREGIGGKLNFNIPRFPLKFKTNVNYDITDGEFRMGSFVLTYDYQCIQFKGELRLFRYSGRVETQFNFGVSFGNLGMVKDFLGIEE